MQFSLETCISASEHGKFMLWESKGAGENAERGWLADSGLPVMLQHIAHTQGYETPVSTPWI